MPEPYQEMIKVDLQAHFRHYRVSERKVERERAQERQDDDDDDGVDDSIDEEDTMDDFLELEEEIAVECGAPHARRISVPSRERTMMMKKKGKEKAIKVKGKFLMDGPWWNASFKSVMEGDTYICQGSPTYTLRNENGEKGKALLQLLLRYVFNFPIPGSEEDKRKEFWDYFEKHRSSRKPKVKNYTFYQFFKALEDALEKKTTSDPKVMQAAMAIMKRFDPFYGCSGRLSCPDEEERKNKPRFDLRFVYRCYKFHRLFTVLPLLLERQALSILSAKYMKDLETLDSVLQKTPEDLGFYTSMREHNWGTIEASFQGFVNAGMMPANLFKCTAKRGPAPHPSSSKSTTNKDQPSTSTAKPDQPSTSTAKPDNVAPKPSRPSKKRDPTPQISVKMANVLKLYDIVKLGCNSEKHTFLLEGQVKKEWKMHALTNNDYPGEESYQELKNRKVVEKEKEIDQPVKVHWVKYRRYEKSIASSIKTLFGQHEENQWTLPLQDFSKFNFDPYQEGAANTICLKPVTIILGRGGCGKTHVVASVIKQYLAYLREQSKLKKEKRRKENQDGECECPADSKDKKKDEEKDKEKNEDKPVILLTAPTGRASSILKRRIGMDAKTLHSVRGTARKSNPEDFLYSKVEILVVDECSMVPISVLSEVLDSLLNYSLKKVIFLGDPYQLPSIDPGDFFQDIINVFQTTNPDSVQTLKINHRTDEGGKLIDKNSRRIAEERRSDLFYQPDRFELINVSMNGLEQTVKDLIESREQLQDHKNSQAVSFRNVDVKIINRVCCKYYAAHSPFKRGGKLNYHIGDKICARKNCSIRFFGRTTPKDKEKKDEAGGSRDQEDNQTSGDEEAGPSTKKMKMNEVEQDRINNGDTFFIENWRVAEENDRRKRDVVTLHSMDEEEGNLFEVDFKEMRTKCKVQYAWARTINTFQGSETDYIVYVISPYSRYENWQHLYTAITRGIKGCFIVGTLDRLRDVVRAKPIPRQTSLARFLTENFHVLQPDNRTPNRPAPTNPRPNLPGQPDNRTPNRPAPPNLRPNPPGQPDTGTPDRPAPTNLRFNPPGQPATRTPDRTAPTNLRPNPPGQPATRTPNRPVPTNQRPNPAVQPATRTPDRPPAPTNVSSSNRATACSPCKWTLRQEEPVSGSLVHGLSASNQATPLQHPYQQTPWVRQEINFSKSTLNEIHGSKSSAVDSPAAKPNRRSLSRKRKAKSNNDIVNHDQGSDAVVQKTAHSPKAPKQQSSGDAAEQKTAQSPRVPKQQSSGNAVVQKTAQSPKAPKRQWSGDAVVQKTAQSHMAPKQQLSRDALVQETSQSPKVPKQQLISGDAVVQKTAQSPKVPKQQSSGDAVVQKTAQSPKVPKQQSSGDAVVQKTAQSRRNLSRKQKAKSNNVLVNHDQGSDALVHKTAQNPKVPKQQLSGDVVVHKTAQSPKVPKQQLSGYCQESETLINVPGLRLGKCQHTGQESQPSSQSSRSNKLKEECHFEDSDNEEPSQLLLQPPSVPLVLSLLKSSEEFQKDDDDTDWSSSDESGFSSSGTSPCVRIEDDSSDVEEDDDDDEEEDDDDDLDLDYNDAFGDDDEDEELSQSIFQLSNLI